MQEHPRPAASPSPEDQLRRTSLLTQLALEFRETLDSHTIAAQALRVLGLQFPYDGASALLVEPSGAVELGLSSRGGQVLPIEAPLARAVLERGLAGWAIRNSSSIALPDVSRDRRWLQFTEQHQSGSVIVLPIRQAQSTLGALTVHRSQPNAFTSHDLLLLEGVAAQMGVALGASRHFRAERRRRDQALALFGMSQYLSAERAPADLAITIQERGVAIFEVDFGLLFLCEPDGAAVPPWLPQALHAPLAAQAEEVAQQACDHGQIVVEGDCVGLPLVHAGHAIGAVVLAHESGAGVAFSADIWSLLTIFTHVIAAACGSAQLIERLRSHAVSLEALVEQRTAQLQRSRNALRTIVDSLLDGALLLDADERVAAINVALANVLIGGRPQEIVGRGYTAVWQQLEARGEIAVERATGERWPAHGGQRRSLVAARFTDAAGARRRFLVERSALDGGQHLEIWRESSDS